MKVLIIFLIVLLAFLQQRGSSGEKGAPAPSEDEQVVDFNEQLTVRVTGKRPSAAEADTAVSAPVKFTVKNISHVPIALMHVMDYYRNNVGIRSENETDDKSKLFQLPGSGNGKARFIAPGETFEFQVEVPLKLFKPDGKRLVAIVVYGGMKDGIEFRGRSHSRPFTLPSP